jgi:hypothetical protein
MLEPGVIFLPGSTLPQQTTGDIARQGPNWQKNNSLKIRLKIKE